ncbi:hypothetical protein [Pseudanabaena sp. FACHB-2040]|uniref:hypothetical protein n=1 Tax=Pseudanabaena sp. FACHB-2040 TaxID=2692859 RepID=UPI001684B60E|nr:hypothetical protein [Pseudanabaena sp. FACHB-2040]MBD2258213.1 hypothetical protein [Pseudanabaena sp. FACHB-2040]
MRLSDFIQSTTAAGTALFLRWEGYHVFSIPKRELLLPFDRVRLFGVGGKRQNCSESFAACALREGREEIGNVINSLTSAQSTLFLHPDGTFECVNLLDELIRPRLIWEKRTHSDHGSMADSKQAYYLVAFNAELGAKPQPCNEIAALVYLNDDHLSQMRAGESLSLKEWIGRGAKLDYQGDISIPESTILVPHGTIFLLMQECAD